MSDSAPLAIRSVLIVEDHKDAMKMLSNVSVSAFDSPQIETATTLAEGLDILKHKQFDMALLDLGLPDGNGTELVKYISMHHRDCLSVVTTIISDEDYLFDALRAGACGYLLKGYSKDELEKYLIDAVSGKPPLSPGIANSVLRYFQQESSTEDANDDLLGQLTERELEIFTIISKGYRVKEVAELLSLSANTVSHHIKNVYGKLNVHNRAEATAVAVQLKILNPS